MRNQEIVVTEGVEGGGVTLYGQQVGVGWRFRRSYADETPLMLDQPGIESESEWFDSWEAALRDIDQRRWWRLPAIHIHPQFRHLVWAAVQARMVGMHDTDAATTALLHQWKERCDVE
jgi:hypothetical protein